MDWKASQHGAWKELHMNTGRHTNEFSDFPWKKEDYSEKAGVEVDRYDHFPHSTEAYQYLKAYADYFDINDSMILNTRVVNIERSGNNWIVHTEDENKASTKTTFNGLVMCQGRYQKGSNPLVNDGPLDKFSGDVIHSSNFNSIDMAKGKRVLVVGSSVSGCDITGSIARDGKATSVDQSLRHVPYILNHVTDKGAISDEKLFSRLIVWLNLYLPESMNNDGFRSAIVENFPLQVTKEISKDKALVPDPNIAKAGISYSYNWVETMKEGKFALRQGIQSSQGKNVTFTDSSSAEYDLIICATGYSMDLSILPQEVAETMEFVNPWSQQKEVALYKWTLVPDIPTIAVCGAQHLGGSPFPCFEMNARWIANIFANDTDKKSLASRPSEGVITKAAADFKAFREASAEHKSDMAALATELMAQEMGLTPSKMWALWNSSKLLFAHPYSSYFRTDPKRNDPKVAAKAQERFDFLVNNVPVGLK